jgi:hypothetical protein
MGKKGKLLEELVAAEEIHLERALHGLISQYLNLVGIFYVHSRFGKKSTCTPGTPDFVFAVNGQACAIECKTADGELSEDQDKAIAAMRKNGWAIEICTSIQQAIGFINRFKK